MPPTTRSTTRRQTRSMTDSTRTAKHKPRIYRSYNTFVNNITTRKLRENVKKKYYPTQNTKKYRGSGYGRVRINSHDFKKIYPLCQMTKLDGSYCSRRATYGPYIDGDGIPHSFCTQHGRLGLIGTIANTASWLWKGSVANKHGALLEPPSGFEHLWGPKTF